METSTPPFNLPEETHYELFKKLDNLDRLLLGLNAYGSLELRDLELIESYLKGAFGFDPPEEGV